MNARALLPAAIVLVWCAAPGAQESVDSSVDSVDVETSVPADTGTDSNDELDRVLAKIQDLRVRAARLRQKAAAPGVDPAQAEQARDLADDLDDIADDLADDIGELVQESMEKPSLGDDIRREIKSVADTIVYLTKSSVRDFVGSFRRGSHKGENETARRRGYGGGLGFQLAVHALDMGPLYELFQSNQTLRDMRLPIYDSYETVLLFGGTGYAAIGNGVRVGGAGWGGSLSRSRTTTVNTGTATVDSVYGAEIGLGMGGFMLEKAWAVKRMTFVAGGTIGAGGMGVTLHRGESQDLLGGNDPWDFANWQDEAGDAADEIGSGFLYLEAHGSFMYSILPWLHMGVDISCPVFVSPGGFQDMLDRSLSGSYYSVSPGGRLRIVLGNVG